MDYWAYEYFKAFQNKDLTVLSSLYAEDVVLIEHPGGKTFEGKEAVLAENKRLFEALPNLQIKVVNQGTESNGDGPSVFNHIEVFDGGRWIPVVDIITYRYGQIAKIEAFVG